jgi:hypothetical protein
MMKTLPAIAAFFAASALILPTVSHAGGHAPRTAHVAAIDHATPATGLARA